MSLLNATKVKGMKKIKVLIVSALVCLAIPQFSLAQNSVFDRLKQKVKDRANQKVDETMDKGLDKAEETAEGEVKKGTGKSKGAADSKSTASENTSSPSTASRDAKSFSRYDFVPGEQIVYAEDFSQDVIGEFPLKWITNNRGEVVTLNGQPGKWLRMFHTSHFVSPQMKNLSENYTVEFDMVLTFPNDGSVYPELRFKLFHSPKDDINGKKYLQNFDSKGDVDIVFSPGEEGGSSIRLESNRDGRNEFVNDQKGLRKLDSYYGRPFHVAIWVQKQRLRMWIEGEKVYDIPQVVPSDIPFNRMDMEVTSGIQEDNQIGLYLSNIKFAIGSPDMRNKLINEGKFVTSGILFDVNADKIKPESYGVLKELATVLKENPAVKVKVIGHTDSDGDEAKNLDLSKRRAASVKKALSTEFGIDASRLETDGKGETQPMDNNTSAEGKAKNRRVEFIKL